VALGLEKIGESGSRNLRGKHSENRGGVKVGAEVRFREGGSNENVGVRKTT
jgi:hypothetical protein